MSRQVNNKRAFSQQNPGRVGAGQGVFPGVNNNNFQQHTPQHSHYNNNNNNNNNNSNNSVNRNNPMDFGPGGGLLPTMNFLRAGPSSAFNRDTPQFHNHNHNHNPHSNSNSFDSHRNAMQNNAIQNNGPWQNSNEPRNPGFNFHSQPNQQHKHHYHHQQRHAHQQQHQRLHNLEIQQPHQHQQPQHLIPRSQNQIPLTSLPHAQYPQGNFQQQVHHHPPQQHLSQSLSLSAQQQCVRARIPNLPVQPHPRPPPLLNTTIPIPPTSALQPPPPPTRKITQPSNKDTNATTGTGTLTDIRTCASVITSPPPKKKVKTKTPTPPPAVKSAMAELSSLSQRWSQASQTTEGKNKQNKNKNNQKGTSNKNTRKRSRLRKAKRKRAELAKAAAMNINVNTNIKNNNHNNNNTNVDALLKIEEQPKPDLPKSGGDINISPNILVGEVNSTSIIQNNKVSNFDMNIGLPNTLIQTKSIPVDDSWISGTHTGIKKETVSITESQTDLVVDLIETPTKSLPSDLPNKNLQSNRSSLCDDEPGEEMDISDDEDDGGDQASKTNESIGSTSRSVPNINHQKTSMTPQPMTSSGDVGSLSVTNIAASSSNRNNLVEKKLKLAMLQKKLLLMKKLKHKKEALKANEGSIKVKQKKKIRDLTAFKMKTLVIKGILSSGPAHKLHPINIESILDDVSSNDSPSASSPKNDKCLLSSSTNTEEMVIKEDKQTSIEVEKLKFNLELAKRKLKLKTLLNARAKKGLEPSQESFSSDEVPKDQGDSIMKDISFNETSLGSPSTEQTSGRKETATDLRKRQNALRETIKQSKETHKELKDDKEIKELKEMVEKQRRMLQSHGLKINNCRESRQQCVEKLKEIQEQKSKSKAKIEDLMRRRIVMEKMIASVSKKIIDARCNRKRKRRKKLNKSNTTDQG